MYRSDSILTKYSQDRKELLLNHSLDTDCNQKDGFWGKNEDFHFKPVAKNVLIIQQCLAGSGSSPIL